MVVPCTCECKAGCSSACGHLVPTHRALATLHTACEMGRGARVHAAAATAACTLAPRSLDSQTPLSALS